MRNFDKIKSMNFEEFANILIQIAQLPDCVASENQDCEKCAVYELCAASEDAPPSDEAIRVWLKSEVETDV